MLNASKLSVKVYADGADIQTIRAMCQNPYIQGFTTNPSLMRKSGVQSYETFAKAVLEVIGKRPISLEVFSDDFEEMALQAKKIASWGSNVYVKIPVCNTRGKMASELIRRLSHDGIKLNVTALYLLEDVVAVCDALRGGAPNNISVFAGRTGDTGVDPLPVMRASVALAATVPGCEVIWASTRELLNVVQAAEMGCHIITVPTDIINKLPGIGKSLREATLETVRGFYDDATKAAFTI